MTRGHPLQDLSCPNNHFPSTEAQDSGEIGDPQPPALIKGETKAMALADGRY